MNRSLFAYMGIALICSLAVGVVQMLAVMAGDTFSFSMVGTVILQALWSMPFAVLAYFPPAKWIKS
jgi:hypothetical protein